MQICTEIFPGKRNASLFGCCKFAGHAGLHINGKRQIWGTRIVEPCDSNGKPMPVCKRCGAEYPKPHGFDCPLAQD